MRVVLATSFAAEKHRNQRRKGKDQTPYINHPIEVAAILVRCGVWDENVLIAALLHDTVEDTDTTFEEIELRYGERVRRIVEECTDDKKLPKVQRKIAQVEHVRTISTEAKLVKMADKIHNLSTMTGHDGDIPLGWDRRRVQGYFVWARKVCDQMTGINALLDEKLDALWTSSWFIDRTQLDGRAHPTIPQDEDSDVLLQEYYKSIG
jgi:guanosine-3',5'-bis(diphosphate) 3'-pyrophosphohydrolase